MSAAVVIWCTVTAGRDFTRLLWWRNEELCVLASILVWMSLDENTCVHCVGVSATLFCLWYLHCLADGEKGKEWIFTLNVLPHFLHFSCTKCRFTIIVFFTYSSFRQTIRALKSHLTFKYHPKKLGTLLICKLIIPSKIWTRFIRSRRRKLRSLAVSRFSLSWSIDNSASEWLGSLFLFHNFSFDTHWLKKVFFCGLHHPLYLSLKCAFF